MPRKEDIRYLNDCVLVVGGVQSRGCVTYAHSNRKEKIEGQVETVDWQTHKRVSNIDEQKKMITTRLNLERKLTTLGTALSGFGWIIPVDKTAELATALAEIRQGVREYNPAATCTKLFAWLTIFDVRSNDEKIAGALYEKAINLLNEIETAVREGDVKALREALRDMRGLDTVLPTETAAQVSNLIIVARAAAKEAVKAAKDAANEEAARTITQRTLATADLGFSGLRAAMVETAEEIEQLAEEPVEPASPRGIEEIAAAEEGM